MSLKIRFDRHSGNLNLKVRHLRLDNLFWTCLYTLFSLVISSVIISSSVHIFFKVLASFLTSSFYAVAMYLITDHFSFFEDERFELSGKWKRIE